MATGWMEWVIHLKCKRCNRSISGYIKASRMAKKAVGCKVCGLHTSVDIKEHKIKVGGLEISVYMPYYC